jgi:two-component sensor histidine kinase
MSDGHGSDSPAERTDGERLYFEWAERGGPPVSEPTRKSFGTRMMTSLGQQLKGKVELAYKPGGFVYTLDVPIDALASKS